MTDDQALYEQLKDFTTQEWQDWTEDILCFNMALPFSRITADGDVLMDVVNLLHNLKLPIRYYTEAVVNLLNEFYDKKEHPDRMIRLLNVLIVCKSARAFPLLRRMLFDKNTDLLFYQGDSIKAKILQAITQLDFDPELLMIVDAYMKDAGHRLFHLDLALAGTYLRFSLTHFTEPIFFADFTAVIVMLDKQLTAAAVPFAITTLEDKLRELYHKKVHIFYSRFYDWLVEIAPIYDKNPLLKAILEKFNTTLKQRYSVYRQTFHPEQDVAEVVMTVMALITDPKFIAKSTLQEMKKTADFLFDKDSERLADLIASGNSDFIMDEFDSFDYSINPDLENSQFAFRGKLLNLDSYKYLIFLLQRAELILSRQPLDKFHKRKGRLRQLREEVFSDEDFD